MKKRFTEVQIIGSIDEVRVGHQPENCEESRPYHPKIGAGAGGRPDSVIYSAAPCRRDSVIRGCSHPEALAAAAALTRVWVVEAHAPGEPLPGSHVGIRGSIKAAQGVHRIDHQLSRSIGVRQRAETY